MFVGVQVLFGIKRSRTLSLTLPNAHRVQRAHSTAETLHGAHTHTATHARAKRTYVPTCLALGKYCTRIQFKCGACVRSVLPRHFRVRLLVVFGL